MQEQRQRYTNSTARQRSISREERSPSVMITALTVGAVVLLLAVTFVADWLRTPELTVVNAPQFLSPNSDNSYDSATISFNLSEVSEVSARVLTEGGGQVRTLFDLQKQSAGQHFLVWNGADDTGRAVSDGVYRVEILAKGSVRTTSTSVVLHVDTVPPTLQLLNLQDGSRVREELLPIEGITEPDATIWINASLQPVLVDGLGRFRAQQKLNEGSNTIQVRAVDRAGNTSITQRTLELTTVLPEVVIINPAEGAWINNPMVTVEGQAPPGINLKINNQTVPVSPDGFFRYDLLLDEGDQRIQVIATDEIGNVTSVERIVRVKTRGPQLELNIADGATYSDTQLQLTGKTAPGSTVMVNEQPVSVGTLGDFHTTVRLFEGDNVIYIEARDPAGNVTGLSRRVRYLIPTEPQGWERLLRNLETLPGITIPAILLLSLVFGVFLYRQNQLEMQLTVDTQAFTPGLPQEGKTLTLRLDLSQPARVTLEVLDESGETQALLLDNRRKTARQHTFLWDGYDDYGRPVTGGQYTIRATAGAPPIKVSSAVQVQVDEDPYVHSRAGQFEQIQPVGQVNPRRRLRQNRKRIR